MKTIKRAVCSTGRSRTVIHRSLNLFFACSLGLFLSACGGGGGGSASGPSAGTGSSQNASPTTSISVTNNAAADFTYTNTDSTSAANGFGLIIKAGGLSNSDAVVSVQVNQTQPQPLSGDAVAAGVVFASNLYTLSISPGTSINLPMAVTIPYNASQSSSEPTVLYWNPNSKSYEGVQVLTVDPVHGTVTFVTSHFSDYIAVFLKVLNTAVTNAISVDTHFDRTVDEFRPVNIGNLNTSPEFSFGNGLYGNCTGTALLEQWYFKKRTVDKQTSGIRPDSIGPNSSNQFGDSIALNAMTMAQYSVRFNDQAWINSQAAATTNSLASAENTTVSDFLVNVYGLPGTLASWPMQTYLQMVSTGMPVALMIKIKEATVYHTVLAYAASVDPVTGVWSFSISDPNVPYGYCYSTFCDVTPPASNGQLVGPSVTIYVNPATGAISAASNSPKYNAFINGWLGAGVVDRSTMIHFNSDDQMNVVWSDAINSSKNSNDYYYNFTNGLTNFLGHVQLDNITLYSSYAGSFNPVLCATDNLGICGISAKPVGLPNPLILPAPANNYIGMWGMRLLTTPQSSPPSSFNTNLVAKSDFPSNQSLFDSPDASLQIVFGAGQLPLAAGLPIALEYSAVDPSESNPVIPFGDILLGHKTVTVIPTKLELDTSQLTKNVAAYDATLHTMGIHSELHMVLNDPNNSGTTVWSESMAAADPNAASGLLANQTVSIVNKAYPDITVFNGTPTEFGNGLFQIGNVYTVTFSASMAPATVPGISGTGIPSLSGQNAVTSKVDITIPQAVLTVSLPAVQTTGKLCGVVPAKTLTMYVAATSKSDIYSVTLDGDPSIPPAAVTLIPDGLPRSFSFVSATNNQMFNYALQADGSITGSASWVTSSGCQGSNNFLSGSALSMGPAMLGTYDYGTFIPAK